MVIYSPDLAVIGEPLTIFIKRQSKNFAVGPYRKFVVLYLCRSNMHCQVCKNSWFTNLMV